MLEPDGDDPSGRTTRILTAAVAAPSGHNTQPWRFELHDGEVRIFPDRSRRLPVVDPDDHALFISLGCAVENLVIAAGAEGLLSDVDGSALGPEGGPIIVRFASGGDRGEHSLARAIHERQTTRRTYDGRPIPPPHLARLEAASRQEGVQFRLFLEPREIAPLVHLVQEGNRRQFGDPAFVQELISWVRFNRREIAGRKDGLSHAAMGFPSIPRWAGRLVMTRLTTAQGQARSAAKAIRSSSALMLFSTEQNGPWGWVNLGRSFERVALTATLLDIRHAHMNMPCEVPSVREALRSHLRLGSAHPLLLLRIGYAKPMARSPRRPLDEVVTNGRR